MKKPKTPPLEELRAMLYAVSRPRALAIADAACVSRSTMEKFRTNLVPRIGQDKADRLYVSLLKESVANAKAIKVLGEFAGSLS